MKTTNKKKDRKALILLREWEEYYREARCRWVDYWYWADSEQGKEGAKQHQLWASFWYNQAHKARDRYVEYCLEKGFKP